MSSSIIKDCTGLVVAGGEGRRMAGQDKGLLAWGSGTLASHAAQRFHALGLPVLVSANRNQKDYEAQGLDTVCDIRKGYQGPLAALEAGLTAIKTSWLLAIPCDNPALNEALIIQLWEKKPPPHPAVYARCGEYSHPICCAIHRSCLPALSSFLEGEQRRVMEFWKTINAFAVDLGLENEAYFANANTPEDYAQLRARDGHIPLKDDVC